MSKRIIISCGDLNGIGLRCIVLAISQFNADAEFTIAIPSNVLAKACVVYGLPEPHDDTWTISGRTVNVLSFEGDCAITPGIPNDDASRVAIHSLEIAIQQTVDGAYDAVVTLPINKHALSRVGWPYAGQTEMLGAYAKGEPLMVLCTSELRVALATVHIPLRAVAETITTELVEHRTQQLWNHLHCRLGIAQPTIAVLALNPHAGDNGVIGDEDNRIVAPAIQKCRVEGMNVTGPHPADGFFAFGAYRRYDGILAMYHDQGLIPLKLLAKGAGVNVTAGLSILRVSPDHGTAYDRATSTDIDSMSSLLALEMAVSMSGLQT